MTEEKIKDKLVHAQTVLFQSELERLKKKTGQTETGEALRTAIEKYLGERK